MKIAGWMEGIPPRLFDFLLSLFWIPDEEDHGYGWVWLSEDEYLFFRLLGLAPWTTYINTASHAAFVPDDAVHYSQVVRLHFHSYHSMICFYIIY